jgi:hypothetical protein
LVGAQCFRGKGGGKEFGGFGRKHCLAGGVHGSFDVLFMGGNTCKGGQKPFCPHHITGSDLKLISRLLLLPPFYLRGHHVGDMFLVITRKNTCNLKSWQSKSIL